GGSSGRPLQCRATSRRSDRAGHDRGSGSVLVCRADFKSVVGPCKGPRWVRFPCAPAIRAGGAPADGARANRIEGEKKVGGLPPEAAPNFSRSSAQPGIAEPRTIVSVPSLPRPVPSFRDGQAARELDPRTPCPLA